MCKKLIYLVSCVVLLFAASSAQAAVLVITPDAPVPGATDIANLVGAASDIDNVGTGSPGVYDNDATTYVAHDRGGQGQTFVTGDKAGYLITGIWLQHVGYTTEADTTWYSMQAGSRLQIRVTDPTASGTDAFVLSSEIYDVTGQEENALPAAVTNDATGTSLWFHVILDAPVALAANTEYGFDLTSISGLGPVTFFETLGIRDDAVGGNPYPDGSAYVTGAGGVANYVLTPAPGDRIFVVELEALDMVVGFTAIPPVLDGEVDEIWAGAAAAAFVPLADPANGSGTWKVLYDAENLYVLVDITDDSLQNDSVSSWQDDSVEIYFDGGNTKLSTPLSGDDHQYTFGWTTDDIQGTNIAGYTEGIEHGQATTETGWRIEVKMPWQSIWGVVPQAGDLIGIDCYYNDDDDGGDSREGKMLSFSAIEGWNDASQWGTAVLAAEPEQVPVDPGTEGLVAHYAFENDTADSSGNGLDGVVVGDPAFVDGVEGMALDFNGDDYVDCGGAAEFSFTEAMTVSTWVNIRSRTTAWMAMIAKGENAWRLGVNNQTTGIHYAFSGGTRDWQAANTATELPFGEWHHVAATYDTSVGALVYIDGVVDASNPNLDGIDTNAMSLLLGENPEATGRLFDGMLDEVMIYNRALSEAEILYLAGKRVQVDPVHSYTFEDGTGNDSVGLADGVLVGDTVIVDGSLVVDGAGDWMEMPGDVIAINTYSEMTLELWSTQSVDNPFSMTASFGGTWNNGMGKDYIFIATGRGDQMNRGSIANTPDEVNPWEDEVGVSSPELNDGIEHHYVLTITAAELAYYVDGVLIGTAPMGDTTIGGVSNDFVFLGKGIYSVDPTMNCSINEFNIYDVALDGEQIAAKYAAGPVK